MFKLEVGPEWGEGKPVILFNGWIGIGKSKLEHSKPGAELHLRVRLDPDPRYVFQFEDETKFSPQIVKLQGAIKQPIFSCKFSQDRVSQVDPLNAYWSADSPDQDIERRERKGWKVKIHDLSGSAIAAAFITTPFVPSTGCDWVARSNPGAWLIVRPDACGPESWQPWGKLEAWRERGTRDSICCHFHLLSEFPEGGEFLIVQGEGKKSKPLVQLATHHVTCVEDAAIFMALSAAVDLSIEACRPFRRKTRRGTNHSW
ncbi:nuclear factor 1 A-type protein [Actinidia rufa]|uniref:Nuclear factor 1 A-type protein n=1 Tax=Actinidia rufa TaxID=165716 RepID=A0A7J0FPV0_9ERIC|nr:nuclear factor 1 A-type protein [Actinidia rufa]